ncbi:MAG: 50S ribosomal protein L21 [Kiritimatiellaeota bacterium]|nr:50S ribosomal protein L21 [Kiritimatiellota bacterium]
MEAYAVVETGGKQYLVHKNDKLEVEKLPADKGATVTLERVLAVSDGQTLKIGAPVVGGAAVLADVVDQIRGPKTISFKKKKRKGYHKKIGHRQSLTCLCIKDIQIG